MSWHRAVDPADAHWPQAAMRVAAYTRVAVVDRHHPSNLERRQAHLCAVIAAQPRWRLVVGYTDIGSDRPARPGLSRLLGDAAAGRFDLVVLDDADRLCRDRNQLALIARRLAVAGVGVCPLAASPRRRGAAALTSLVISDYLRG